MVNVLFNIALLLSLSVFFATYPFRNLKRLNSHRITIGIIIGFLGILLMLNPFVLFEGVVFDSRTILLTVSGMVFGLLPTAIGAVMMGCFRIIYGGGGIWAGLATILSSSCIGVMWHRIRYESIMAEDQSHGIEYYMVGVFAHLVMLACMLLMPSPLRFSVISAMSFPILVYYPVGTYLLSLLLFNQAHRMQAITALEKSERLFKTMFEQAPIGMSLTNLTTGAIKNINPAYLAMLGYEEQEMLAKTWTDITHPDDLHLTKAITTELNKKNPGPYQFDKRFIRKDGTVVWANLSLSIFNADDPLSVESLCMTVDITERKLYEQKILYASAHDELTGLHNRSHFENFVRDLVLLPGQSVTVAFADVNGLRILNEAFGREEGNLLLKRIALILEKHLRSNDYLSRVGGDEFALILFNRTLDESEALLASLKAEISAIEMMGSVHPSVSFGLCRVDRISLNEAIKQAEKDVATRKLLESPHMRGKAVYAIINTLHEKNKREELHSRRVSELCETLSRAAGMGDLAAAELRVVGLLHDIGKIAIHESVLNKQGRLTGEEWKEMQRHAEIGYRILNSVEDMATLAQYVLAHHEHYDGSGYPKGLVGSAIPLQSRIIAIADAYDAMTADRPYRSSISSEEAGREIKRNAGRQFDPNLARIFVTEVLKMPYDEL
ncbi:MAG: HD domain-containing phosphohydrolase [Sphaerochaeta sp.]|uniref:HD domain-containing phosphohydrolase n=1 Tax=Sphaerochaeta sp. TaxID=1972642 RepID=UPI003D0A5115